MNLAQIVENVTSLSQKQFANLSPEAKKSLLKKHQRKFFEIAEGLDAIELTKNERAELNKLFKNSGLLLWAREENLFPAIQPKDLAETLRSLQEDEKLHVDNEQGVFRIRKVRKMDSSKVGEKSKEAYYAVLNELKRIENPNVELYLALINSSWFKHYATGEAEQAAIIALSARFLDKLLEICETPDFPYQKRTKLARVLGLSGEKSSESPYMLHLLKTNNNFKTRVLKFLDTREAKDSEHKLPEAEDSGISQLSKDYFLSGNIHSYLKVTGDKVHEPATQTNKYQPLDLRFDFGTKVIALDALGDFVVVNADEANLIAKNKAYQFIINEFNQGIDPKETPYLLNGQHFLDYLESLTASLMEMKENQEQFLTLKMAVEKMERFLAAMPFQQMTHQDQIIKGLHGFYEAYDNALYNHYFETFQNYSLSKQRAFVEFKVNGGESSQFIESLIEEINNKASLDEQILFLEHLASAGAKARKQATKRANRNVNHLVFANIAGVFENLNLDEAYLNKLSKRARQFYRKAEKLPSTMGYEKTRFIPKTESQHYLLSKIPTETYLQSIRRKHNKLMGYVVGGPLALGSAALVTFAAVTLINPVVGFILGGACLIINAILYPDIVSSLLKEGVFTVGDHTIAKPRYKWALRVSFASTTILALLLSIATAFAIVTLSASTFGLPFAVAIMIGVGVGLVTWLGNTFLNADVFRTVFAYFDKWGFTEGWKRIKTTLSNFFSYKDCRDWRDVVRQTVKVILQPLFIFVGLVFAIASSVALIGVLRGSFLELMTKFNAISLAVCEILANILVRGIGLFAELPLELKSAGELFNRWARAIGNKISSAIISTIDGMKFLFAHPREALNIMKNSFGSLIKNSKNYVSGEIKAFNSDRWGYVKKIGFAILNAGKQAALILNAIGNGYFAQSGAEENNTITGHVNDKVVGTTTTVAAGVLSYGICKSSVDKHEEDKGNLAFEPKLLSSTKQGFFTQTESSSSKGLLAEQASEDGLIQAQDPEKVGKNGYSAIPSNA